MRSSTSFFEMAKIRSYAKFESFQKVGRLEKTLAKNSQNVVPLYSRSAGRGLLRRRVGRRSRSGMIKSKEVLAHERRFGIPNLLYNFSEPHHNYVI